MVEADQVPTSAPPRPDELGPRGVPGWTDPDTMSRLVASSMRLTQRLARGQLDESPMIPRAEAPWADGLEAAHPVILEEWRELRARCAHIPTLDELVGLSVSRQGQWSAFGLLDGEGWYDDAGLMPRTVAIVKAIPGIQQASFSILAPHSELTPHRGPNPGVARILLGVDVPEPERCGLRVGSELLSPVAGQCLIFDDTFEHTAWNDGDHERVMLMLEVRRRFHGPARASNAVSQALYRRYPQTRAARRRYHQLLDVGEG